MKILLTDILFPNIFSRWRNVEILSFMKEFHTDILVYKIDKFYNLSFSIDYNHEIFFEALKDYNILIFDSRFNSLNSFNKKIDGTKFNGHVKNASYLITKDASFSINSYDKVYHIFLMMHEKFNKDFSFDQKKQFIHLYPGGGMINQSSINGLSKKVNLVTTHPLISSWVRDFNYIECIGGTLLFKNERMKSKPLNTNLGVCFSSLGSGYDKGDEVYCQIVDSLSNASQKFRFYSVGNCKLNKNIKNLEPMSFIDLDKFYFDNIDIYINTETGKSLNGWPIGVEANIAGSAILTTDSLRSMDLYKVPENSIKICNTSKEFVDSLINLDENRKELEVRIKNCQDFLYNNICYENQQDKIFNFLRSN